ncbi:hypothetical protein [Streptomyces sioyaensis]|uniref:hypothetical protein n=1 Tax=Streptomyces sioyaensis TaxID=67364 RepID=UPI003795CB35
MPLSPHQGATGGGAPVPPPPTRSGPADATAAPCGPPPAVAGPASTPSDAFAPTAPPPPTAGPVGAVLSADGSSDRTAEGAFTSMARPVR